MSLFDRIFGADLPNITPQMWETRVEHSITLDTLELKLRVLMKKMLRYQCSLSGYTVAADILSVMEELGFDITDELAKAIVNSEEETALKLLKNPIKLKEV